MIIVSKIARIAAQVATLALYLLTFAAAYGGHLSPYVWATPSVLTLFLPYLAIATFIVTIIWAIRIRLYITALGVITIIACWSPIMQVFPFGYERVAQHDTQFSLLTFNILHADDVKDSTNVAGRALSFILDQDADIVCLQEFLGKEESAFKSFDPAKKDSLLLKYRYFISDPHNDLTLLSKYPAKLVRETAHYSDYFFDIYNLEINHHKLTLINVHMTPYRLNDEERNVVTDIQSVGTARKSIREFKGSILHKIKESFRQRADAAAALREIIDEIHGPLIICGDFNDVPASFAYRTIRGKDLSDAYTETNFGHTYTYNEHLFLFHIDQILYKGNLRALKVNRRKIDTSDHYPLYSVFEFTN